MATTTRAQRLAIAMARKGFTRYKLAAALRPGKKPDPGRISRWLAEERGKGGFGNDLTLLAKVLDVTAEWLQDGGEYLKPGEKAPPYVPIPGDGVTPRETTKGALSAAFWRALANVAILNPGAVEPEEISAIEAGALAYAPNGKRKEPATTQDVMDLLHDLRAMKQGVTEDGVPPRGRRKAGSRPAKQGTSQP